VGERIVPFAARAGKKIAILRAASYLLFNTPLDLIEAAQINIERNQ
jgi:hypothetical protein